MKIKTVYDVRREKFYAQLHAEHRAAVREARTKVRYWERKVVQFGGDVHVATLNKFKAQLAALVG